MFRIDASNADPVSHNASPPADSETTHSRAEVNQVAKRFHRQGYWVEVFDVSSGELLAGAYNPDQRLPAVSF